MIPVAIDTETTSVNPHQAQLLGCSKSFGKGRNFWIPKKEVTEINEYPSDYFTIAQNGKYDAIVLAKYYKGMKIDFDTMIAQYLLDIKSSRKLENMVKQYFNIEKEDLQQVYNRVTGENRKTLPDEWWTKIPADDLAKYAVEDVEWTYKLYQYFDTQLEQNPVLEAWFEQVEMPLLNILTQVELKGVKVDKEKLTDLKACMMVDLVRLDKKLKVLAGKEINYNSPKQLQEWLFNDLKLKSKKKTKTGQQATDHKTLEILANQHAVPKLLLQRREIDKLLNTYCDPIINQLDANDRLHCTYNQALTVTRRFSSENPNLQNIPNKSERGLEIQECFIPEKDHKFLIADYDQVELRLLSHFSKDPTLIKAFKENIDVHQITADFISKKLGRDFDRAKGKLLNFSLLYGKTAYGFAQDWNCSQKEAEEIINMWFALYPKVKEWSEAQQYEITKNKGYAKSIAGLPLYCGDPLTNSRSEYEHYLRCCVNYPIQASSQDILKKAIVEIHSQLKASPVLMVHDSLIYEIKDSDFFQPLDYIDLMESAWKLEVPVKVSFKVADKWIK